MKKELSSFRRSVLRMGKTGIAINKLTLAWFKHRHDEQQFVTQLQAEMQSLGSTYIKLGQLIASSPTLFPAHYVTAFEACLDQTEPYEFSELEPTLIKTLGHHYQQFFSHIERKPLASASIAQVHAAQLKTGEHVVLKIQKPAVRETLETDFGFLHFATSVIERFNLKAWKSSLLDIVEEIRDGMLDECDFEKEAQNIALFKSFLVQHAITEVVVPQVYEALSSKKLLVMERFFGVPITDSNAVIKLNPKPDLALAQALDTWFLSLKQCKIYHADLHAGNMLMLDDGRIGFIDFGIVGRLSAQTWEGLDALTSCIPQKDFTALAVALAKMGATSKAVDIDVFAEDLANFWHQLTDDGISAQTDPDAIWKNITIKFSQISSRHGIRFPREFTLLVKQFLYFDRYINLLAPEMGMFNHNRMDMMGLAV